MKIISKEILVWSSSQRRQRSPVTLESGEDTTNTSASAYLTWPIMQKKQNGERAEREKNVLLYIYYRSDGWENVILQLHREVYTK